MQHWTITRDAEGNARLRFDQVGASANTLRRAGARRVERSARSLERDPPRGLVIASGKANGFIAGADVDEFMQMTDGADALALVKRGWDTFERLAAVEVSDGRADPRLLPGRRTGARARLPLSRGRRRAGNASRATRGDARDRARVGRHEAVAAIRRRAGGARSHVDRDARSTRVVRRNWASPTNACLRGSWRTPCAAS